MIREERRRLTAAWLNILAAGVISAGAVAPVVSTMMAHVSGQVCWAVGIAAFWLVCGLGLHLAGRAVLGQPARTEREIQTSPQENK
jgi:hypothetical protein